MSRDRSDKMNQTLPPSYTINWDELDPITFQQYGLLCRITPQRIHVCNVPMERSGDIQSLWGQYPTDCMLLATATLAFFLEQAASLQLPTVRDINFDVLVADFAESILCTMPDNGGRIPLKEIESWFLRQCGHSDDELAA